MSVCVSMRAHARACVCLCMFVNACVCMSVCACVCVCVRVLLCAHVLRACFRSLRGLRVDYNIFFVHGRKMTNLNLIFPMK